MRLKNAPIVEAWIEFHLQASEQVETWEPEAIDAFFEGVREPFGKRQNVYAETFEVVDRLPTGEPREASLARKLARVRAFDDQRSRCLQVGENTLVVNMLRHGTQYPGFPRLQQEALERLADYVTVFRPQHVRFVALHYTDIVELPAQGASHIQLEDYFNIGLRIPEGEHWPLSRFASEIVVSLEQYSHAEDRLILTFQSTPKEKEQELFCFRMDWHATCYSANTLDAGVLSSRLQGVHDALKLFFRRSFTDRTWTLFGPIEDD